MLFKLDGIDGIGLFIRIQNEISQNNCRYSCIFCLLEIGEIEQRTVRR